MLLYKINHKFKNLNSYAYSHVKYQKKTAQWRIYTNKIVMY